MQTRLSIPSEDIIRFNRSFVAAWQAQIVTTAYYLRISVFPILRVGEYFDNVVLQVDDPIVRYRSFSVHWSLFVSVIMEGRIGNLYYQYVILRRGASLLIQVVAPLQ